MNMGWLYHLVLIFSLSLTVFGEQTIELLNLCETSQDIAKASSQNELPLAVSLNNEDLNEVSSNILSAETWLRSNVFPFYPSSKITNIVGKTSAFCQQNNNLIVVLSALKNLYHSLTRWGLEKNIKVSIAFHLHCFTLNSPTQTHDFKMLKHMTHFLQTVNSTISLIPPHSDLSDKNLNLVTTHLESMKKFGFFNLNNIINVVSNVPKERKKTITRKLSVTTIPIRPTPFPEIAEPPLDFPVGYPIPSNFPTTKPLPPLAQVVSSPPPIFSPNFAPQNPPNPYFVSPASSPHYNFNFPPCNPRDSDSPSPQIVPVQKLWCVAKPSVPEETLQQALDYACGEGGADCLEITTPEGNCYYPDTLVSHASYAFNSYWQKHKINGGTCNFGGTAMLIHSDPSFLHCRFILS